VTKISFFYVRDSQDMTFKGLQSSLTYMRAVMYRQAGSPISLCHTQAKSMEELMPRIGEVIESCLREEG